MERTDFQENIEFILSNNNVWLLEYEDGLFAMHEGPDDAEFLPVWATEEEAKKHCVDDWHNYHPSSMKINELVSWLEELDEDDVKVALFPDENMSAYALDAESLIKLFLQETKS